MERCIFSRDEYITNGIDNLISGLVSIQVFEHPRDVGQFSK